MACPDCGGRHNTPTHTISGRRWNTCQDCGFTFPSLKRHEMRRKETKLVQERDGDSPLDWTLPVGEYQFNGGSVYRVPMIG